MNDPYVLHDGWSILDAGSSWRLSLPCKTAKRLWESMSLATRRGVKTKYPVATRVVYYFLTQEQAEEALALALLLESSEP